MRTPIFCFLGLLLLVGCNKTDSTVHLDPADFEWSFDLNNRVDSTKYVETFNPGDRLAVKKDTLIITNDFGGWPRKYPLFERSAIPDSTFGFVLDPQPDSSLIVAHYYKDSLKKEWHFLLAKEAPSKIPEGVLTGKTYRFNFPGLDSLQVYVGYDEKMIFDQMMKEYFVSSREHIFLPKTRVSGGGVSLRYNSSFNPSPFLGGQFYFPMGRRITGFNRTQYMFEQTSEGQILIVYIMRVKDRFVMTKTPLDPIKSVIPSSVSEDFFAERISTGKIVVDQSYPRIDSANVSYLYTEDFYKHGGLDPVDLNYLEFSFNPDGEYFILVQDRLIKSGKWEFSPDRNYIVTLSEAGEKSQHFPILAYTDEYIDLRMPLLVKTREPRGVKLESYGVLDAFVRVQVQ